MWKGKQFNRIKRIHIINYNENHMKTHQNDTKTFDQLTKDEQSKSVNAQLINVERAMIIRIRDSSSDATNGDDLRRKYINKLGRIIENLRNNT